MAKFGRSRRGNRVWRELLAEIAAGRAKPERRMSPGQRRWAAKAAAPEARIGYALWAQRRHGL